MSETKNQKAWEAINKKLCFVDKIKRHGSFDITAKQIDEISGREPRLMAKFDHSINRPKIFQENNLSILPIAKSSYKIIEASIYHQISTDDIIETISSDDISKYETIDIDSITSEDKAIIAADIAGILSTFTEDNEIRLSTQGKFRLNDFTFKIKTERGLKTISAEKPQAELDAGFEGHRIYLIEAKLGKVQDFNIRQLYYPFKYWHDKSLKKVVPIFLTYSDKVFNIWEFKFTEHDNFHSLTVVKQKRYIIDAGPLPNLSTILRGIGPYIPNDESIPFPQADDFEKIINIIDLVFAGINSKEEFADEFEFDKRQADYYYNAAKYLDLVNIENGAIYLTNYGCQIAKCTRNERHMSLVKRILRHKVFYDAYTKYSSQNYSITLDEIVSLMRSNHILNNSTDNMLNRRAQTVLAWCKWIAKTFNAQ